MSFSSALPFLEQARESVGLYSLARRIGLCFTFALLALPANAAQLVLRVTVTNDSGAGSFRDTIVAANQAGTADIDLGSVPGELRLQSPLPTFTGTVRLLGPQTGRVTLDGDGLWPLLSFAAGSTGEVRRVLLTHALATGYRNGAAISNAGRLVLQFCAIVGNRNEGGWGGGLYNEGSLQAYDCEFRNNVVAGEVGSLASYLPGPGPDPLIGWQGSMPGGGGAGLGGGVFHQAGYLALYNCELTGNEANGGSGGNFNSLILSRTGSGRGGGPTGGIASLTSQPSGNGGFGSGGGGAGLGRPGDGGFGGGAGGIGVSAIPSSPGFGGGSTDPRAAGPGGGGAGMGGAIFARTGTVFIAESTFVSNRVSGGHGGDGPEVAAGAGAGLGGALFVHTANVTVGAVRFSANHALGGTGGAAGSQVVGVPGISGEGQGGAVFVYDGSLEARGWRATTNTSQGGSGSPTAAHPGDGAAARGGMLAVAGGRVSLDASTFAGNQARGGLPAGTLRGFARPGSAFGGALWVDGGTVGITNCTLSANQSLPAAKTIPGSPLTSDSWGGALAMETRLPNAPPVVALRFCTVTLNEATRAEGSSQGGGLARKSGTLSLAGVICAANRAATNADLHGQIQSVHRNLIQTPGTAQGLAAHDLTGLDPLLSPLEVAENGMPVHRLLASSPALDAYDAPDFPPRDAVSLRRPQGPAADLGAVESPPPPPSLDIQRRESDGNLTLTLRGTAGLSYILEFSKDLRIWSQLAIHPAGAILQIPADQSAGFYRLTSP